MMNFTSLKWTAIWPSRWGKNRDSSLEAQDWEQCCSHSHESRGLTTEGQPSILRWLLFSPGGIWGMQQSFFCFLVRSLRSIKTFPGSKRSQFRTTTLCDICATFDNISCHCILCMICKSIVWSRHTRRHTFGQYLTGSVYIILLLQWCCRRRREMAPQRSGTSVLPPAHRMFEKPAYAPHTWPLYATLMTELKHSYLGSQVSCCCGKDIDLTKSEVDISSVAH